MHLEHASLDMRKMDNAVRPALFMGVKNYWHMAIFAFKIESEGSSVSLADKQASHISQDSRA